MAKSNNTTKGIASAVTWKAETTLHFQSHLSQIKAVLTLLIVNVGEYKEGDGRATDECLFLAVQQAGSTVRGLEKESYELDGTGINDIGDLSLLLMWARSLLELLEDMGAAELPWKFRLNDHVLCGYFACIERGIESAIAEVESIHSRATLKVAA